MEHLLQGDVQDSCLSYCPLPREDSSHVETREDHKVTGQAFHIALQTPEQSEYLQANGSHCVLAFVCLCGKDINHLSKLIG